MWVAESKKYYWLKLKRDFFKRHDIRIIEEMPNGKDYILFYLKLLLESIDHEGNLRFSETIPYNEQMLSIVTNTNLDTVKSAMRIFTELNMVELLDDQTIYMTEVDKLIGSAVDNDNATRQRRYREKQKKLAGDSVTKNNASVTDSVTKDNESKRIEKDTDIDTDIELDKTTTAHTHAINDPLIRQEVLVHDSWGIPVSAILLISNSQIENLHKSLSEDELYHYIEKMREMTLNDYKFSCSHYEYILKMADADRRI